MKAAVAPHLSATRPADNSRRYRNLLLGLLAGALLFPFFWTQYALTIGTEVLVAALFAIGLNILIGTTGLVSLGSSMFVGLGGYGVGVSEFMTEARRGWEAESLPWQYDCHHIPV